MLRGKAKIHFICHLCISTTILSLHQKMRAKDKIKEIQEMLVLIEDEKKPIYEILKQEREAQE